MDSARYYVALALLILMPGGLLYWCWIHPFVAVWRRIGPRKTVAVNLAGITLAAFLIFQVRQPLLAVQFGTNPVLIVPGVLLILLSAILRRQVSRQLTKSILIGM